MERAIHLADGGAQRRQNNIGLPGISKASIKAAYEFLRTCLFYTEQKSLRAAQAADKWEDVFMKRLENIKTVIDIAQEFDRQINVIKPEDMKPVQDFRIKALLDAATRWITRT
jgi:hypothetical protein